MWSFDLSPPIRPVQIPYTTVFCLTVTYYALKLELATSYMELNGIAVNELGVVGMGAVRRVLSGQSGERVG